MNCYKGFLFFSSVFLIFNGIIGRATKETYTGAKISRHDTTVTRLQEALQARQPVFIPLQVVHSFGTRAEQAAFLEEHHEVVRNSNPSSKGQQSTEKTPRQRNKNVGHRGDVVKHPSSEKLPKDFQMDTSTTDTVSDDFASSSMSSDVEYFVNVLDVIVSGQRRWRNHMRRDTSYQTDKPRRHRKKKADKDINGLPIIRTPTSNFVIRVSFGTPPQEFLLVLDTGCPNVKVVGVECTVPSCLSVNRYDRKKSQTAHADEPLRIEETRFGTGTVNFFSMRDRIQLGSYILDNQVFSVITDERKRETEEFNVFDHIHFEGILGLGSIPGKVGFFDNVLSLLPPDVPKQFGIYTSNFDVNSMTEPYTLVACLFVGLLDNSFYQDTITYFPVDTYGFWQVGLKEIWIGDVQFCCDGTPSNVVFDSGTSFNTVPQNMIGEFLSIIEYYNVMHKRYPEKVSLPNIVYKLDSGAELVYTPAMYRVQMLNGDYGPGYMGLDCCGPKKMFLLGSIIHFRSYFTVFHYPDDHSLPPRIGVAKAKHSHENTLRIKKYDRVAK